MFRPPDDSSFCKIPSWTNYRNINSGGNHYNNECPFVIEHATRERSVRSEQVHHVAQDTNDLDQKVSRDKDRYTPYNSSANNDPTEPAKD